MSADLASQIAAAALSAQEGGPPVLVATVIAAPAEATVQVGAKLLLRADGSSLGALDEGPIQESVRAEAADAFRRHGVQSLYFATDGAHLSRREVLGRPSYQVMLEVHERAATLLIVGGGHIGSALATIGNLCDFSVAVVDDRADFANAERFPQADTVICGDFVETLREFPIDANTYIVCVTRGHKHDEASLRQVAGSPAAYIGMIGSRRRVGIVLNHLREEGVDPEAIACVHTPIGLDIGAETPEEIAVSIMAEVIQVRRGGSGRSMRELKRIRHGVAPDERIHTED
ncbi:MAG: XdhC/CoxI family protein [Dehalococcoidia bacterium]